MIERFAGQHIDFTSTGPMTAMMKNWARTLSWDYKGAMCTLPWVFAHSLRWSPGEITLPDGITPVPRMRLPFELSSFCSHQAQSSIPYTKLSSSILHGVLFTSIENGHFFTWYQVWALLDCGASYPFGPFVKMLHNSGWCTVSYVALRSCFTSSSSVHKTLWDYPKTNVHCRRYSVDKRSSQPCLANCQAVFRWQEFLKHAPVFRVQWHYIWLFWSGCSFDHTNWCVTIWYLRGSCLAPSPTSSPMMDLATW